MRGYVGRIDRPIQVVLVEGNTHAQRVIAGELQKDPRIDLRAIASSLQDVKRILAQQEFDVMLLDLQLQSGQCLDVIDQVKQCMPLVEVVATSIDDDEALAMLAFEKGATGYLVKSSWFVSYGDAILEVVHGGAPVTASITRRLLPRLRNGAGAREHVSMAGLRKERSVLPSASRRCCRWWRKAIPVLKWRRSWASACRRRTHT